MNKSKCDEENYKLDIFKTMFANIFWVMLLFLTLLFIFLGYGLVVSLEVEINRTLATIVYLFAVVKLIAWNGKPHIYFKYV